MTESVASAAPRRTRGCAGCSPACLPPVKYIIFHIISILFSPRAKRAGPKGLRAESARAVTGRQCPHSGKGEDFLTGQLNFFTETAVPPERKVNKSFPRSEINRHVEGSKWVIDQNWGRMAKIGFLDQNPRFWAQKKDSLLRAHHVLATTGKSCSKKKSALPK